jgi:adenosylmethionine-8-amino-7-oxononanoate aminotransferase
LLKDECRLAIAAIEYEHRKFCESIIGHKNLIKISSLGTILSMEIKAPEQTGYFNSLRDYCYDFFMARDILLRPLGNVIYFLPPYTIQEEDRKKVYRALTELLNTL